MIFHRKHVYGEREPVKAAWCCLRHFMAINSGTNATGQTDLWKLQRGPVPKTRFLELVPGKVPVVAIKAPFIGQNTLGVPLHENGVCVSQKHPLLCLHVDGKKRNILKKGPNIVVNPCEKESVFRHVHVSVHRKITLPTSGLVCVLQTFWFFSKCCHLHAEQFQNSDPKQKHCRVNVKVKVKLCVPGNLFLLKKCQAKRL